MRKVLDYLGGTGSSAVVDSLACIEDAVLEEAFVLVAVAESRDSLAQGSLLVQEAVVEPCATVHHSCEAVACKLVELAVDVVVACRPVARASSVLLACCQLPGSFAGA